MNTIGFANLSEDRVCGGCAARPGTRGKDLSTVALIYVDNNLNGELAIRLADELIEQCVETPSPPRPSALGRSSGCLWSTGKKLDMCKEFHIIIIEKSISRIFALYA